MSDSVLKHFSEKLATGNGNLRNDPDEIGPENLGAFGWLRGRQDRAHMLQLRRRDGNIVALGFSWLERCDYDPSEGITLRFTGQTVRLVGRNLNREVRPGVRLFDGLVRHRVPWVQEADAPTAMTAGRGETVIERIEFE